MSTTLKVSNGDLDIDEVTGMATVLSGVEKCSQDVANVLMTDLKQNNRTGTNFRRAYGNELATLDTPVFFSGTIGKPLVSRKIQEAVETLINAQNVDPNVTSDEAIDRISRLVVEPLNVTDYIYFLEVVVRSNVTAPPVTNLEAVRLDHQFPMSSPVDNRES